MILQKNCLTPEIYTYLRNAVGWSNYSNAQVIEALKKECFDIVAYQNEQAVGMARVIGDGIYYMLVDVVVHPSAWHQGIGSAIIKEVISEIRSRLKPEGRCSLLLVSVQGKESFYRQFGFKEIPDVTSGQGMQLKLWHIEE